jgi:hypothetical protein
MARPTLGDRLITLSKDGNLSQRDREFAESLLKSYLRKNTLSAGRRPWVDKLEARAVEAAKAPKGEVPAEFVTLRDAIVARHGEGAWAFKFITSIMERVERGGTLTESQQDHLNRIQADYTDTWDQEYRDTYREGALVLAGFYRRGKLPYWKEMVAKILDNEEYVPRKTSFLKLWNNRYAKRVVEQASVEPAFAARAGVQLRSNDTTRTKYRKYMGKKAFILSDVGIIEAVKGGRGYTVLFAGDPRPVVIEERYLMRAR